MSQKKHILKQTVSMGIATYIAQGLGIVTSIGMRAFLGPAAMGVWALLQVILTWCGKASFGTTKAMARDYPLLRGKGDHDQAEHLKDLTLTFSMIMSVIPAILIIGYLIGRWPTLELSFKAGLIFLTGFLFLQRFYDLIITLLRSDRRFDVLSKSTVLNAFGMLVIVFLLVRPFNIYGLFMGTALVTLLCLFYIQRLHPYHFQYYWNNRALWDQLKLGLPLIIITFIHNFFKNLDKLLIAKYLGFADVGLYSLATMIASLVFAIPLMLSNVLYPHTLEEYGRKRSPQAIEKHLNQPILILSIVIPILCGAAFFLFSVVVDWFLPKFTEGLPAMKIYLAATFFVLMTQFASNVLTTLDKYWINVPIILASMAVNLVLNLLFIHAGFGLIGVAWGTAISFACCGIATYVAAAVNFESWNQTLRRTAGLTFINLAIFAGILVIDLLPLGRNLLLASVVKTALLAVFAVPFMVYLERKVSLWSQVFRMFKKEGISESASISTAKETMLSHESVDEEPSDQ